MHAEYRNAPIYKNVNPLQIPAVHISRINGGSRVDGGRTTISSPSAADAILKRAGISLQKILRNEYGNTYADNSKSDHEKETLMQERNPLLAHLRPVQALERLKRELKNYQKGVIPFDQKLCENESVLDWWIAIQQDDEPQVLRVRTVPFCAPLIQVVWHLVTLGSHHQTVFGSSGFNGWRTNNVNYYMAQHCQTQQSKISTLWQHIQICQWHRYHPNVRTLTDLPSSMTQATFIEWQSSKMVDHKMAGHGEDYQQHVWQRKDIYHQPPGQSSICNHPHMHRGACTLFCFWCRVRHRFGF